MKSRSMMLGLFAASSSRIIASQGHGGHLDGGAKCLHAADGRVSRGLSPFAMPSRELLESSFVAVGAHDQPASQVEGAHGPWHGGHILIPATTPAAAHRAAHSQPLASVLEPYLHLAGAEVEPRSECLTPRRGGEQVRLEMGKHCLERSTRDLPTLLRRLAIFQR